MERKEVWDIFKKAGAILEGHFILTSGRHSAFYIQKARVFMHANITEKLCKALSIKIRAFGKSISYVVGPAIGGLIPAYETSRHLEIPAVWVEREKGVFRLRRFEIERKAKVVIIEDIITTGLSVRETIEALRKVGIEVVAVACIFDRSGGKVNLGEVPLLPLASFEIPSYSADALPKELAALPAIKLGSRNFL